MYKSFRLIVLISIASSCGSVGENKSIQPAETNAVTRTDTSSVDAVRDSTAKISSTGADLKDLDARVTPHELVAFGKSLIGIPYKYASFDPKQGFDCSGFITYTFNHFGVSVPRSSIDFTNVGKDVSLTQARAGDLILFTGTVDSIRVVGHMGIVTENADTLKFIHSTSGNANGVTISPFSEHYQKRFVKVVRIFE